MCGIVGFWSRTGDPRPLTRDLGVAVERLRHRGPDDEGIWSREGGAVALGHTRLSILDLSTCGHQPMLSADGRLAMVYNGEVYNFAEIREQLEELGYSFRGSGDSEVILAAYQEWGDAAVDRFVGMFAIAIWDEHERRLRLFRDRVGVKPLYYVWDGDTFAFASELKALLAFRNFDFEIDRGALGEYLQYGYITDPRTIFRSVRRLLPGHALEIGPEGPPEERAYWSLVERAAEPLVGDESVLAEQLEDLLTEAFEYRMVSDVPVGVFLSGGIDSSLVTALLARRSGRDIRTFTIGFGDGLYDESSWAGRIAEELGTEHTSYRLSGRECAAILERWGDLYDEPFGDSSGAPTQLVSKIARQEVKVALSADGGDEVFGGYSNYRSLPRIARRVQALPRLMRSGLGVVLGPGGQRVCAKLTRALPFQRDIKIVDRMRKLRGVLPEGRPDDVFDQARTNWRPEEIATLLGSYDVERVPLSHYSGSFEEQMMLWDFHHYLADDILTKVDRATMSVGLEGREPMLDHRVVEFGFRLPLSLRLGELGTKHMLRRVLYKYLPRELVERPKQGFQIPLREWLLGDLSDLTGDMLAPDRIRQAGIFRPETVEETLRQFRQGTSITATRVWLLLAFELWRERWAG